MQFPFFSIIIPCYNTPGNLLVPAVQSVLDQDYKNFEIIIVDDGSEAECRGVLQKLADDSDQIKLYTINNSGVSAARNYGMSKASGDYISFVDSDDELMPGVFTEAVEILNQYDVDYIVGGVRKGRNRLVGTSNRTDTEEPCVFSELMNAKEFRQYMISPYHQSNFQYGYFSRGPVARFVRKEIAMCFPFDAKLKIGEDAIWNLDVLENCRDMVTVKKLWYWYKDNEKSATTKYNPEIINENCIQISELERRLNLNDERDVIIFTGRVCEGLTMSWKNYLRYVKSDDPIKYKKIEKKLYTEHPWCLAGGIGPRNQAPLKLKMISFLYRHHLLFEVLSNREKLSRFRSSYHA